MRSLIDPTTLIDAVGLDWTTPSRLRPLYRNDPALIWLEHHGGAHGFIPDSPTYSMMAMLEKKGHQFEMAWLRNTAPDAVKVCDHAGEARHRERVQQTIQLMHQGVPVIAQPALWWPPERLYGVPDLIVRKSWVRNRFPDLLEMHTEDTSDDSYLVIDLKFTSNLINKKEDFQYYSVQVRLYSFMLGQIQGVMPTHALLITRDTLQTPLMVMIQSRTGDALDDDLAQQCAAYRTLVNEGGRYRPWIHSECAPNYSNSDERWMSAKKTIMRRVAGGALEQMWQIGENARRKLMTAGITSLDQLVAYDHRQLPKGILKYKPQMLAIMEANRTGVPNRAAIAPPRRRHEFVIDCEFFSSINVDFENDWPELKGTPMIFMVGVGWSDDHGWHYRDFVAPTQTHSAEYALLHAFVTFMLEQTAGNLTNCVLYHWSNAERSQTLKAADRHCLEEDHILRHLPWEDLERHTREQCCAIPGAWNYALKSFVHALSALDASFDPNWPTDLEDGGVAQVMAWEAYDCPDPLQSREMVLLRSYLAADCRAVYQVLRWFREEQHNA